jgi:hypothetical protein
MARMTRMTMKTEWTTLLLLLVGLGMIPLIVWSAAALGAMLHQPLL